MCCSQVFAQAVEPAKSGEQVESLKESVLTLNRDLLILEEELLYPASSQVAIYVSMDLGTFFALDAIKLEIDNKLVASELYTDKQTKALFRGGVQRLYIGNLKAGEHEISAFFTGRGPQQDYKRGAKIVITKAQEPVVLELRIVDSTAQLQPVFDIKQWQM
ncbi:MAG TPA: AraC family transcriptional regulator [Cellvibrio sp.]|nr:AraC family transcriptional regulator [Cellvibrio sp.]